MKSAEYYAVQADTEIIAVELFKEAQAEAVNQATRQPNKKGE